MVGWDEYIWLDGMIRGGWIGTLNCAFGVYCNDFQYIDLRNSGVQGKVWDAQKRLDGMDVMDRVGWMGWIEEVGWDGQKRLDGMDRVGWIQSGADIRILQGGVNIFNLAEFFFTPPRNFFKPPPLEKYHDVYQIIGLNWV